MPEEIKLYVCTICKSLYDSYENAERCENQHPSIKEIKGIFSDRNYYYYPHSLSITFNNGKTMVYSSEINGVEYLPPEGYLKNPIPHKSQDDDKYSDA